MINILKKQKWLGIIFALILFSAFAPAVSLAAPGDIVRSFGSPGGVADIGVNPTAIAQDSTGMYVAGYENIGFGNSQWRIEKRSLATGDPITSFGTAGSGAVTSNPSGSWDSLYDIAIDSAYMYVVGSANNSNEWRIEKRSLATGDLITSFGTGGADGDGVVTSDPSSSSDEAYGIAIDSAYMYIVGHDYSQGNAQWRIEKRSLATGDPVASFGTGGVYIYNPSGNWDDLYDIATDSTSMYIVGSDNTPGNTQWRIEKRSLATGDLITSFGTGGADGDGVVTFNPSSGSDEVYDIAIDSTSMYVVGYDSILGNSQFRIEKRSLATGDPVASFGTNGVYTYNRSSSNDYVSGIYLYGNSIYTMAANLPYIELLKINKNTGTPENCPIPNFSGYIWGPYGGAVAADSTGVYVGGGYYNPNTPGIYKVTLTCGSLATTFGTRYGKVNIFSNGKAYSMASNGTYTYVVGYDNNLGNAQWRVEKITQNGSASVLTTSNLSSGRDVATDVAVRPGDGIYVVGYDSVPVTNKQWRIEKYNFSGAPQWSKTSDPSSNDDRAYGVAVGSDGIYVIGCQSCNVSGNGSITRIEKWDFNGNSIWGNTVDVEAYAEVPWEIAVDSTGMYIGGISCGQNVLNDTYEENYLLNSTGGYPDGYRVGSYGFLQKRTLTSLLSLMWSYSDGHLSSQPETNSIALDSVGVYVPTIYDYSISQIGKMGLDKSPVWGLTPSNNVGRGILVDESSNTVYFIGKVLEARDRSYGNYITTFGSGGVVSEDGIALALDNTGLYILDSNLIKKLETVPGPSIDCGLRIRIFDGAATIPIACEPLVALTSALRIFKNSNTYGIVLVDISDPNASKIRIQTSSGVKALRKF